MKRFTDKIALVTGGPASLPVSGTLLRR